MYNTLLSYIPENYIVYLYISVNGSILDPFKKFNLIANQYCFMNDGPNIINHKNFECLFAFRLDLHQSIKYI